MVKHSQKLLLPLRRPNHRLDCSVALLITTVLFFTTASAGPHVAIYASREDAIYAPGDPVKWRIEVSGAAASNIVDASYVIKQGGLTRMSEGTLPLTNGATEIVSARSEPGTLLLEIKVPLADGQKTNYLGAAVISPGQIKPSSSHPDDFDAFWETKLEELAKIPMNPKLTGGDSGRPATDYWQITMDNIRSSRIRGQLARPRAAGKYPAMLIVQAAGVSGLKPNSVTSPAAKGWLALNILAHDLPIDESPEFYTQQMQGPLQNYWFIGNKNRETSYFLRMYLSCYRAVQYLTARPDWDGKTLLVTGVSQGGLQALITAGLHPKVTAAIASVPGGCDLTGAQLERNPGWPMRFWKTKNAGTEEVIAASRYYDVVNFAPRIKCPVLVGIALLDDVCPPAGIFAAVNQASAPKEVVIMPQAGHLGDNNAHQSFKERNTAWQAALIEGKPAPVRPWFSSGNAP
jgi:cephalosporin-C deacetylase